MPFNPNAQERLVAGSFDPLELLSSALNTRDKMPWDSIVDFATHRSFCDFPIYPKQATLLKLIFLETENMTAYDVDVIESWRKGFIRVRDVYGVQPDIWERIAYLKARGYRRFPHIQAVLGRRASKGIIGAFLGCEQMAFLHSLDDPQPQYAIAGGKDVYLNVGATSQTVAMRQLFADVRTMVENCKYFSPPGKPTWIAESKDHILRVRTPADLRRIAELKAAKIPIDHQIATLCAVALSASSVAGRGATSYCLDPETPVLTADLRWVPIKSLLPGDEVVGVDEEPPGVKSDGRRLQRKLRKATVLGRTTTVKQAYRLRFTDGSDVVCSADHRWLVWNGDDNQWVSTRDLVEGDGIVQLVDPWGEDDTRGGGYLAGIYDADGSISMVEKYHGISVFLSQNPGPVLDRTLEMLKAKGFEARQESSDVLCQKWSISGLKDVFRFLGQFRPVRLLSKSSQAYEGLSLRGRERYCYQTIVQVEEMPEQELIDIQTTTKTFIANGLVSHNCNMFDEFAFHVQTGSVKSDSQIYKDWQPSLGQFGIDALTYIPSSPWTRVGHFHTLYAQGSVLMSNYNDTLGIGQEARATLVNNGVTMELDAEPTWLIFQGPSWALYEDWDRANEILSLGYVFPKAPEPDLTDERQIRERRRDPEKFKVEKEGQFAEVQGAYLDPDKVDLMFSQPHTLDPETGEEIYWRDVLTPASYGAFNQRYRMHCDPGLSGANFAMAIGHLEDAPPDDHGHVWPHVIFDLLQVWRPMDYPEDPETRKQYIDYVQVHNELEGVIDRFPSLDKVTFDQWQSQSFIAQLKQRYMPNIKVLESTFTDKVNQERMGKFKSALNLGWVHAYPDNFYQDDLSCLLELELKYLYVANNGKVVKNDVGPVVTKDLADCVMEVTVDLLGDALDRWPSSILNAHSFGSSDVAGLRSGREFDRLNSSMGAMSGTPTVTGAAAFKAAGLNATSAKETMSGARLDRARREQQGRGGRRGSTYQPGRTNSIHRRDDPGGNGRRR